MQAIEEGSVNVVSIDVFLTLKLDKSPENSMDSRRQTNGS